MKIQIISDIHSEFFRPPDDAEMFLAKLTNGVKRSRSILCIAGDLGLFHRPETWQQVLRILARRYKAVVCVPGNHEYYYNRTLGQEKAWLTGQGLPHNVYVLVDERIDLDEVAFVGGVLWTSFSDGAPAAMEAARRGMNDFRAILNPDGSPLTPSETVVLHHKTKRFIFHEIREAKALGLKTVVLTHHGISQQSVHPQYAQDPLTAAFITNLEEEINSSKPDIWIHGHTHNSFAYKIGQTRVYCNPFGYLRREENPDFDYRLKVEV